MTDEDIRALGHVTCVQAAKYLGMPPNHLRVALEQGRIPVGTCIRGAGGRRSIHIEPERLISYKHGDLTADLLARVQRLELIMTKGA